MLHRLISFICIIYNKPLCRDYDEESDSEECKVQLNTDKKNTGESSTTSNDEYNFDAYDDECKSKKATNY